MRPRERRAVIRAQKKAEQQQENAEQRQQNADELKNGKKSEAQESAWKRYLLMGVDTNLWVIISTKSHLYLSVFGKTYKVMLICVWIIISKVS